MNISTMIPNDPPLCLRQKLIDASMFHNEREREMAIAAVTEEIKQRHPNLFWSGEEIEVMTRTWNSARTARLQKAARDAELARLMKEETEHACA